MQYEVKTAVKLFDPSDKRTKAKCPYCDKIHDSPSIAIGPKTQGFLTCPHCKKVYNLERSEADGNPTVKKVKKV